MALLSESRNRDQKGRDKTVKLWRVRREAEEG